VLGARPHLSYQAAGVHVYGFCSAAAWAASVTAVQQGRGAERRQIYALQPGTQPEASQREKMYSAFY